MLSKRSFLPALVVSLFFAGSAYANTAKLAVVSGEATEGGSGAVISVKPEYIDGSSFSGDEFKFKYGQAKKADFSDVFDTSPKVISCTKDFDENIGGRALPTVTFTETDDNEKWNISFSSFDDSGLSTCGSDAGLPIAQPCIFICNVTINAFDDNIDEGPSPEGFEMELKMPGPDSKVSLEVVDNDNAAIIVSDAEFTGPYPYDPNSPPTLTQKNTAEGDLGVTGTFYVELATEPEMAPNQSIDVTLTIPNAFITEGTFSSDGTENASIQLQFTTADWNVGQLVTVYGRDDAPANPTDGPKEYNISITTSSPESDREFDNLSGPQVTVENADNDVPGKVRIKNGSTNLNGNEGATVTVTLERTGGTSGQISAKYTLANVSTKDADYSDTSAFGGIVTWENGDVEKDITLLLTDDTWLEGNESFTLTLADLDGAPPEDQVVVAPTLSTIQINLNDNIEFVVGSTSQVEGDAGNTPVELPVTVSGGTVEEGAADIVIGCATSPGPAPSANAGVDYVIACSGFSYGFDDPDPVITVNVIGDTEYETDDEKFTASLTGAPAQVTTPTPGVVTILDDEPGQVTIQSATVLSGNEGDTVTVTLARVNGATGTVSATYVIGNVDTIDDDRTDTSGLSGTVTWLEDDLAPKDIDILLVDDNWLEGDEVFTVTISGGDTIDPKLATITINQNDDIDFAVSDTANAEGNAGTTPVNVTVVRTGGVLEAGSPPIVIGCSTADGAGANPATIADNDYSAACTGFSFGPDDPNPTVTVTLIGDLAVEEDEEFSVILTGAPSQVTTSEGVVTITNDDSAQTEAVSIVDVSPNPFIEGGAGDPLEPEVTVTVRRNPENLTGQAAVFFYTTEDSAKECPADPCVDNDDNDFIGIPDDEVIAEHRLQWLDGEGDDKTFTVKVYNDTVVEDVQSFFVNIKSAPTDDELAPEPAAIGPSPTVTTIGTGQATVTIAANDAPGKARIKAGSTAKSGNEGSSVVVTVERIGGAEGELDVTYVLAKVGVTEPKPADYSDTSGTPGTISWADGDGADKTVTFALTDDDWLEADESFTMTLEDTVNTQAPRVSTIKINKNDDINFAVGSASQNEGNAGTSNVVLTVNKTGGTVEAGAPPIVLTCNTAPGAAPAATSGVDYVAGCANFSYGSDGVVPDITVVINGDVIPEGDEKLNVSLTGAPAQVTSTPGTITILNDDAADVTIFDVTPNNAVLESAGVVNVTIRRDPDNLTGEVSIYYFTLPNTATNCTGLCNQGDNDFTEIPDDNTFMHTWADGNGDDLVVPVTIIDDTATEGIEDFTFNIKPGPNGTTIVGADQATIEIAANDGSGSIAIDPDSYFVNEDDGTVTITVVRTPLDAVGDASVVYWTQDGTATSCETLPGPCTPASDGDYENIPEGDANTLVFPTGGSMTFDVNINPDLLTEPAEQFLVKIKQASGTSAVDTNPGTVTINANGGAIETPGVISVGPTFYSRSESDGSVMVQVNRVGGTQGEVSVSAFTFDGSAVAPGDYTSTPTSPLPLVWTNGDDTPKFVTVAIIDDSVPAGDPGEAASEFFNVSINNVTGGAAISSTASNAEVEIRDNDVVSPGIINIVALAEVSEGDGSVDVRVSRVGGSTGAVRVDYITAPITATEGVDYVAASGSVSWADGDDAPKFITITILDEPPNPIVFEDDEYFSVTISNPQVLDNEGNPTEGTAPTIGNDVSEVTIFDNDGAGDISIDDVTVLENYPGYAVLTITRSNDNDSALTLFVQTFSGTAISGEDFVPYAQTVEWADNDTSDSKEVIIGIIDNNSGFEAMTESFTAVITFAGAGANIVDGTGVVEILEVTSVPTLSEWSLLLMMLLLGAVGMRQLGVSRFGIK